MKGVVLALMFAVMAQVFQAQLSQAQVAPQAPLSIVSDWTHRHVLYPDSNDTSVTTRLQSDPRWMQNWYLRHPEAWWPEHRRWQRKRRHRDWSVPLSATPSTAAFEPQFDFSYVINLDSGYGSVSTTDIGSGEYLATSGFLAIAGTGTNNPDGGMYPLYPGGPTQTTSPAGNFLYDNVLFPSQVPSIDNNGLLFIGGG